MRVVIFNLQKKTFIYKTISLVALVCFLALPLLISTQLSATEYKLSGLIDVRATITESDRSYLKGGYGKFRYSDGESLSLAQLALIFDVDWENNLSFHFIVNGYQDGEVNGLGITEAFFKYRGLPNEKGVRYKGRFGFMYPKISLENISTGWSSPYTLSFSTMNTWIGEEVRHVGLETSIEKLGKFTDSDNDFTLSTVLFSNNDTNGAMLSWHGWTQSSRQSFWNEKLYIPQVPAFAAGQPLERQARRSDPFDEIDSLTGYQISGQWDWKKKTKLLLGYYDNRTAKDIDKAGQYTWLTKFSHLGFRWKYNNNITLLIQHMSGDTRMTIVNDVDVVGINFDNTFLLLTKKWQKLRFSTRLEYFNIDDFDDIVGDNNDEYGKGITLSLAYKFDKNLFFHIEYNYLDSTRPSRLYYGNLPKNEQEMQVQLAARYFF